MEKDLHTRNGIALYITNVLKKYSDAEHQLSYETISKYIKKEYNLDIKRKAIERTIEVLIDMLDLEIEKNKVGNKNFFYMPSTDFEPGEIRAIIDTFSYATFVPENISNSIIEKCKCMQNIYENKKLNDYQIYSNNIKTTNMEVIKNIEDINTAIYNKKEITFDYYKYTLNPTLNLVKDNSYVVSPYAIIYSIQELYLIGLKYGEQTLKKFRIDRMKNINVTSIQAKRINKKEIEDIVKSSISMYGGKGSDIEVICDNKLLDNVIEVFGKDSKINKYDNNHFKLVINKDLEAFKYYCLRNIEFIKIIKPDSLKKKIEEILYNYLGR